MSGAFARDARDGRAAARSITPGMAARSEIDQAPAGAGCPSAWPAFAQACRARGGASPGVVITRNRQHDEGERERAEKARTA